MRRMDLFGARKQGQKVDVTRYIQQSVTSNKGKTSEVREQYRKNGQSLYDYVGLPELKNPKAHAQENFGPNQVDEKLEIPYDALRSLGASEEDLRLLSSREFREANKILEMTLASAIPVDWPDDSDQGKMTAQPPHKKLGKG